MFNLNEQSDIEWLQSTHLRAYPNACASAVAATIYGNEDSPEKVELFSVNRFDAKPFAVFVQNDEGYLVRVSDV